ncbi:hypothetical protein C4K10_1908 [Pseudomonas chlororaphis subsp. aureofaciens]|uniref:Mor transcription activator family protein n=1 Tax=Pseudomonas chlororaphis TaxID=587753 RepID=UPI000F56ACCF|nr:Mor transcription activator family protein [Pseudomonas chlororaphis]AZE10198.1 hypothetical protein C4K10_1908 [Pseudomonas chlororaphis subsp. aureofaciens]
MNEELFQDDSDQLDPGKILAHMKDPTVLARWEGVLGDMVRVAEAELRKALEDDPRSTELAQLVIYSVCEHLGGGVMYLPNGARLKRAMRDADLYKDWRDKGIKPADLVGKYKISSPTVYDIITRQRALHRRNEPDLFGFEEGTLH